MKRIASALLALLLLAACGSSGPDKRLVAAQHSLVAARDGKLHIVVTSGKARYEVDGPFSYSDSNDAAVLELTYTVAHGSKRTSTKVIATGTAGWIQQGAVVRSMTPDQLTSLRYQAGGSGAVPELHIDDWDDAGTLVTDLAQLAADMEGRKVTEVGGLGKVRSHHLDVKTGKADAFESLHADVTFDSVSSVLKDTLGKDAGKHVVVDISLDPIKRPLKVQTPTSAG